MHIPGFKPAFGGKPGLSAFAKKPAMLGPKSDGISQKLQNLAQDENSIISTNHSMFSNVKPEPPKKITNQEVYDHLDATINGFKSVESFIKENYFKKKNWLIKHILTKFEGPLDLKIRILLAEQKNCTDASTLSSEKNKGVELKGISSAITAIFDDCLKIQQEKLNRDLDTYELVHNEKLNVLVELYNKNLMTKNILCSLITASDKYFPQNLQFVGALYKKGDLSLKQKLHEDSSVIDMYDTMLLEKIKKDGKNGKMCFIEFLKNCNIYNEWNLKSNVIPNAALHRMELQAKFDAVIPEALAEGRKNQPEVEDASQIKIDSSIFEGIADLIVEKNMSAKIVMLVISKCMTNKLTEDDKEILGKNTKVSYQIMHNLCDSILLNGKIKGHLMENQLEALYGCQMAIDELNHPHKLLMAIGEGGNVYPIIPE